MSGTAGPGTEQAIRVVVVSQVRIYRQGLAHLLDVEDGFELVAATSEADTAVTLPGQARIDVLLLDMTGDMAGSHGLETLHRLAGLSDVPCVVMGIPERTADVVSFAEAGIAGYVTTENSFTDLLDTLRSATRGEFACKGNVAAGIVERLAALARERRAVSLPQLTAREQEIAVLLESGLSNKQIAGMLHVQLTTVKNHVHKILEKLGVRGRAEAAAMVREHRLAETGSGSSKRSISDREGSCPPTRVSAE
ncbi:response regulator transcription factor [Amycolatopsis rubida]|uniref:DNA-binding response regulator, NarL/FixJ family, contains REC and HTH domains n=1 Tax=Amycolatopsis rubida TaxID=112413 RepID=A0A1I5URD4_9PSEU|nr:MULTISPECIES: response regulator transcription factor [Amycolatopsis]MYW92494.1 response regulator [Amycolatopsis rubida]NEC57481.1 response regulator transcription factor [Amycolatopsis rubida]OAP26983.1 Transcriptional regulatory protein LiaR [Amycolatopsis sp. M39]SFP97770.1 DNA-binding response regulator, NarL/FixJ family, contains REC and HTH domains [Amycolatopsis rubida]